MNRTSDPSDIISTFYLRKYGRGKNIADRFKIVVKIVDSSKPFVYKY